MKEFNIADLLPMPPWEGPPLPRFLGILWPRLGQQSLNLPKLGTLKRYITGVEEVGTNIVARQAPLAAYQNEESWEISWSPEGLPTKIVVHRNASRNG